MRLRRVLFAPLALTAILGLPRAAAAGPSIHVDLGSGVTLDLVLIPKGTFTQGSPQGEIGRAEDEQARQVTLTEDFYLGYSPVTRGQFARFVDATGYRTEAERGASGGFGFDGKALVQDKKYSWRSPGFQQSNDDPVTIVTYDDALAFVAWLAKLSGRATSLPTEAQWEYAARAGTTGAYYGSDPQALGWFKENAGLGTKPVGKKLPNAFGLVDMSGDVYEWCRDWYAPYAPGPATDPFVASPVGSDTPRRVLRGGSWLKAARDGRSAARYRNTPGSRNADNGFRVAASTAVSNAVDAPAPSASSAQQGNGSSASPTGAKTDGDSTVFAVSFFGAIVAALVGLVVVLLRRDRLAFRMGPDGFWIDASPKLIGRTAQLVVVSGNGTEYMRVVIEPASNGQFVYTGFCPQQVRHVGFLRAVPPPRPAPYRAPIQNSRSVQRQSDPPRPFLGYPPAY